MAIHVYLGFPETKGKRLEEVGQMWDEHVPAWRSASWTPTIPFTGDSELVRKLSVDHVEFTASKEKEIVTVDEASSAE